MVAVAVLLGPLLLGGCGAGVPESVPEPTPSSSVAPPTAPVGPARSLRDLGLRYGPVDEVTLPVGVQVLERIDQPNVVTLVIEADEGEAAAAHLAATLPQAGFTVTASVPGSLTFTGLGWDGAFTTSPEVAGLTLREQAAPQ